MLNSDTAKLRRITSPEVQKSLLGWFDVLAERNSQGVNGRAWRAELRRAEPPYGVMMCEGYSALRGRLKGKLQLESVDEMALALFASIAVHVYKHEGKSSFAAQLGEKLKGDRVCVSALRFERIQKASDPETLCQLLIRAVKIRGEAGINLLSLADNLFLWMHEWQQRELQQPEPRSPFDRIRIRWANEYLSTSYNK